MRLVSLPLLLLLTRTEAAITLYNNVVTSAIPATPTSGSSPVPQSKYPNLPEEPRLVAPLPPQPPTTQLQIDIPADPNAAGYPLSIPQKGNFIGFSIELSVAVSLFGDSPGNLKPTFLNYMANIQTRGGHGPLIRVGGNSQDMSTLFVDGLPDGGSVQKVPFQYQIETGEMVQSTPIMSYSLDLLYTMRNISNLVAAEWYFGLAFNQTHVSNFSPNIAIAAEWSHKILGDSLRGLALGNEPDLYVSHQDRHENWDMSEYNAEFAAIRDDVLKKSLPTEQLFLGPSTCCNVSGFLLDDVIASGWLDQNVNYLSAITVQRYPNNNCQIGRIREPQVVFPDYLNHTSAQYLTQPYLAGSAIAQNAGKEIVMLEMNSASCGGFPGLSNSFGAALWTVDWALQLASGNFSAMLIHVGGQSVFYNPFTPPPHTMKDAGWTTGPIYYSSLIVAEAFGPSHNARVIDLLPGQEDIFHPAYVIYEGDEAIRAVLFNYVSDESGASDIAASVSSPHAQVYVRYFRASSVAEQYDITWAGQTMGGRYAADGRMYGEQETVTVPCEGGRCVVNLPAPCIALVFFTEEGLADSLPKSDVQVVYSTTVVGEGHATVPAGALETGNGYRPVGKVGSTSPGSANSDGSAGVQTAHLQIGVGVIALALAIAAGVGLGV